MRSALAAALVLALLAAAAALPAGPPSSRDAGTPDAGSGAVPLVLEVRASLAVGLEEVPCPDRPAHDCQRLFGRPNVQAAAAASGAYQARSVLEGTGVDNVCGFTAPLAVSCNDTATDPRTASSFSEVVPEDREEVCRQTKATPTAAGVWVGDDASRRCVALPDH